MPTYAMLTRLSPEALARPQSVVELNRQVEDRIKLECPGVTWVANYAVLGPYDYLDIFEAPEKPPTSTAPRRWRCWCAPSATPPRRRGW
jgi:uncharacterized protein with GYD domain